jgi:hypothetical protein
MTRKPLNIPEKFKDNQIFVDSPEHDRNRLKAWDSKIKDFELSADYIKKNHKNIRKWIDKTYSNNNSIKDNIRALIKVLRYIGLDKIADGYFKEYMTVQKEVDKEAEQGTLTESRKEIFICQDEIIKKRDEMKQIYESDKTNKKNNLMYLMLSVYTYQPPLRSEWFNMRLFKSGTNEPPINEQNYIQKKKGVYRVYVNHDKMTEKQKKQAEKREEEYKRPVIELDSDVSKLISGDVSLTNIIDDSLKHFKRDYVISTIDDGGKPMNEGFRRHMNILFGQNLGIDVLRQSYVNNYAHRENELNVAQQKEVARMMRHSWITAQIQYRKLRKEFKCNDTKPQNTQAGEPPKWTKGKSNFSLLEWSRQYRATEKGKEALKRAKDKYMENKDKKKHALLLKLIGTLNNGVVKNPTKASIKKYDLKKDGEKWTSESI